MIKKILFPALLLCSLGQAAYAAADKIAFEGKQLRRDIGA